VKPLIVHLREVRGESDPQLIDGHRYPGNRRPQTEEQKESASGCDQAQGNME
jgi:hypothetical protein